MITALPALDRPRRLADTVAYLRISNQPVFDINFWGSTRPFIFPWLLKLSAQNIRLAAAIQLGFSIFAWGLLAWMISLFLRRPVFEGRSSAINPAAHQKLLAGRFTPPIVSGLTLQPVAFGLILAFSLDRHITGWDFVMMTESLSVSLLAIFIAAGLWLMMGWQWYKVIAVCLSGLLLAFTRDTNAWLLLMLAGLLLIAVILRWAQPRLLILGAFFILTFIMSNANASIRERWLFPLGNLIGQRVLPDPAAIHFFKTCGMPVSPALLRLAGKFANADERAMFEDAQLESFRVWLVEDGRACYMRWLIYHPARSMIRVFDQLEPLIAFSEVDKYFSRAFDPLMPATLGKFFYPERYVLLIWALCTLMALFAIWKQLWKENPLWALFILLILLVPPHLALAWHGDAMAPERHALLVGVQLFLGFWIMVLLVAQKLLSRLYQNG